jgi:lipopolysaccharide export system permease protein
MVAEASDYLRYPHKNQSRSSVQKSARRPMIFRTSLLREFANSAVPAFLVLLGILIATQFVRFLELAARGTLALDGVFALLAFSTFNYLSVLLSLTLFIAVLMTLTRSYRDSEMIIWFCSGVGLTAWIRPVLSFATPLVLVIALLSLVLSPWAEVKREEFRHNLDNRDDVSQVIPGVFQESRQVDRVFFVETVSGEDNVVANIFVSSTQHQKLGVMVAKRGLLETAPNGDRFLVLMHGRRYEGVPGTAEYKVSEFDRYAMRIEPYEEKLTSLPSKSMPTLELLRNPTPTNLAELSWRISLPLSALILALLAIPLSFVNPRAGRSLNLALAILVYMIYTNFLSISQAWIAQEKISLSAGLWGVHAVMLVVLAVLFFHRLSLFSVFRSVK